MFTLKFIERHGKRKANLFWKKIEVPTLVTVEVEVRGNYQGRNIYQPISQRGSSHCKYTCINISTSIRLLYKKHFKSIDFTHLDI